MVTGHFQCSRRRDKLTLTSTRHFILINAAHVDTQVDECIGNIFKLRVRASAQAFLVPKNNDLLSNPLNGTNHRQEIDITGEQVTAVIDVTIRFFKDSNRKPNIHTLCLFHKPLSRLLFFSPIRKVFWLLGNLWVKTLPSDIDTYPVITV